MGDYSQNPFKINLVGLRSAKLVANGEKFPNIPYEPSLSTWNVTREFVELNRISGFLQSSGNATGIMLTDFMQGYGLLTFDLRRDGISGVPSPPRTGSLILNLSYANGIDEVTSYLLFLIYMDSSVYISSSLDVSTDFTLNV